MTYADQMIARAADKVIVSVDRVVSSEDIVARSRETTIPCIYVDAIVELPYGAHPTGSFPLYSIDECHIEDYATSAEAVRRKGDAASLQSYLDRHVHAARTQQAYINTVGGIARMAQLEKEASEL